jgi:hypothetical protein
VANRNAGSLIWRDFFSGGGRKGQARIESGLNGSTCREGSRRNREMVQIEFHVGSSV